MRKSVAIALVDQAVLSLFNLGLNLTLISLSAPAEFGRFVFASAVVLLLISLQNALVATPLAVLVPGRSADEQRTTVSIILAADRALRVAAALTAPVICLLSSADADFLVAASAITFTAMTRETARSLALAQERVTECLRIDISAVVLSATAIAVLWPLLPPAVAGLAGIAIGNALAVVTAASHRIVASHTITDALALYRKRFWPDTQWSFIGAGTTEVQYRSYVFGLELFRDAAALAAVQAGRLLLGPLPLVVGAWARVARPAMARTLAAGDPWSMLRLTAHGMAFVLGVAALYCLVLYLAWPLVEAKIFQGRYPDIGAMTVAWGLYMMVVVTHMVLSVPLQAAMQLKALAQVTMATALLSCLLPLGLLTAVPPIYTVYALVLTEVVALAGCLALVARLVRATRRALQDQETAVP